MFEAPEVRSPKLVVIVGSLGLLSNIVGLFLFHEHGHSHGGGGGGHSHGHGHSHDKKAEEGNSHSVKSSRKGQQNGGLITIGTSTRNGIDGAQDERTPLLAGGSRQADFPALPSASSNANGNSKVPRSVAIGGAETPFTDGEDDENEDDLDDEPEGIEELLVHPARTREAIVRQAYDAGFGSPRNSNDAGFGGHRRSMSLQSAGAAISGSGKRGRTRTESVSKKTGNRERSASRSSGFRAHAHGEHGHEGHEHTHDHSQGHEHDDHEHHDHGHDHDHDHDHEHDHDHGDEYEEDEDHDHGHSHGGHSHDNMNMRGVFLHVMGDAVGVLYSTLPLTHTHGYQLRMTWDHSDFICTRFISSAYSSATLESSLLVSLSGSLNHLIASIRIQSFPSSSLLSSSPAPYL